MASGRRVLRGARGFRWRRTRTPRTSPSGPGAPRTPAGRGPDRIARWNRGSTTLRRGTATASGRTRRFSFVPPLPALFLGRARDAIDDRVDQPIALALDPHHVDVGDDLLVPVEPDRPARRMNRRRGIPNRVSGGGAITCLAFECLERRADELARHVAELGVTGGPRIIFRLVLPDEASVLRRIKRGAVMADADDTERGVAERRKQHVVDQRVVGEERKLSGEAVFFVGPHEADRVRTGEPGVDGVGGESRHLRDVWSEVGGVERRVDLLHDVAAGGLERRRERLGRVAPGHEVRCDDDHLPVRRLLEDPGPHREVALIARLDHAEDPRTRLGRSSEIAGERDRDDQRNALRVDVIANGQRDAAVDRADEDVHLVPLHQLADLGLAHVGLGLVVFLEELDFAPARLVADLGQEELDAPGRLLAVDGDHAGVGQQEADLDRRTRPLPHRCRGKDEKRRQDQGKSREPSHRHLLVSARMGRGDFRASAWERQSALSLAPWDTVRAMLCGSWWLVVIAFVGAMLLGLVLSIVWYWWLLCRPVRAR